MCNRYHFSGREVRRLVERMKVRPVTEKATDVWPTKPAPVVLHRQDYGACFELMKWGLQPDWQKQLLLFARAETVHSKMTFRQAYRQRRCLVAATTFWEGACFGRGDGEPLVFGGVWDSWMDAQGNQSEGFVMVSTPATAAVKPYNDRQPLVLPEEAWASWLYPKSEPEILQPLLRTWDDLVQTAPEPPKKERQVSKPSATEQLELDW